MRPHTWGNALLRRRMNTHADLRLLKILKNVHVLAPKGGTQRHVHAPVLSKHTFTNATA